MTLALAPSSPSLLSASPLALVLFDLDHFKAINDTYGHGKGDEVLAAVGAVVANTMRAGDFVGRVGGEEFAAVLPATDRDGGCLAAEKLREAIAAISVLGVDRRITASFGVAVMPDHAGEPDLLFREADRALYAAKRRPQPCGNGAERSGHGASRTRFISVRANRPIFDAVAISPRGGPLLAS